MSAGVALVSIQEPQIDAATGAATLTRRIRIGSESGVSSLMACEGDGGTARLIELSGTSRAMLDFAALVPAARFMERVCRDRSGANLLGVDPNASPEDFLEGSPARDENSEPEGAAPEPMVPQALDADSVAGDAPHDVPPGPHSVRGLVRLEGVLVMGIQPGGMFGITETTIALFDDGTYTEDLHTVFNEGVDRSRERNPEDWGQWRVRDGDLELREADDAEFEGTRGSWTARAGGEDQRLDGCFGSLESTSGADYGGGTTVGQASTWCFLPDGRFTHSATAFGRSGAADGGVVMRATSPRTRGRYRIDGYVVSFQYDDGREVRGAFSFLNERGTHIGLNGKRFMGSDRR